MYWNGEKFTIQINMRAVDRIEEEINLVQFVDQVASGDIRYSKVANLMCILLNLAGAKVTPDEVWNGMFEKDTDKSQIDSLLIDVINCIFPDTGKKKEEEQQKVT